MAVDNNSLMNALVAAGSAPKKGRSDFATAMQKMGFSSVFDIVRLSRSGFARQLAAFSDANAELAYDNAMGYATLIARLYREYKTSSGKFQHLAQRSGVHSLTMLGPTFPNLFKENWDEFCKVGAIAAVDSPVAYLSELRGFIRQLEETGTDPKRILLDKRRPDLKDLLITQESTFTPRPMLEIVNDVLTHNLQTYLSGVPADKGKPIHQVLTERCYPFTLPYNFYHQQCAVGLEGNKPKLGEFNYRVSLLLPIAQEVINHYGKVQQPVLQAQRLLSGLSPQQQSLLIEASPFSNFYLTRSDLTNGWKSHGNTYLSPHKPLGTCFLVPLGQADVGDIVPPADTPNATAAGTNKAPLIFKKEGQSQSHTVTLDLNSSAPGRQDLWKLNVLHTASANTHTSSIKAAAALPETTEEGYAATFDLLTATGTVAVPAVLARQRFTLTLDEHYQPTEAEANHFTKAYGVAITDSDPTFLADLNEFMRRTGLHAEQVEMLLARRTYALRLSPNHLSAAHIQAYDNQGQMESRPPMEFFYNPFELDPTREGYSEFPEMPGLNDSQRYQLVDLYGEGMPGVLFSSDKAWYYREPLRADSGGNDVSYSDWERLPGIPVADSSKPIRQSLSDLTGDGKLDWVIARPGLSGFFTLNPDRSWSNFVAYTAFPAEFFHPKAQLADLVGDGLTDLALIGPRSVRLYSSRRAVGFSHGANVPREKEDDSLPLLSSTQTELVAFSDPLGSATQHLIRIRHNEVKVWPNLGHGKFGKGFVLCQLKFKYAEFDSSRVRLADLDGSGAVDLIYLESDGFRVYMNHGGEGFEEDFVKMPWPQGVRYDRFCQVSIADVQGLGCSSLILTVPHMKPQHWRYDFVSAKPYLVSASHNNMGAVTGVSYRSSAQEWLDEKAELIAAEKAPVCHLPFAMHLVSQQTQLDEITGNRLTQGFTYRQGFYDSFEREFRGFGLLLQTDTEASAAERSSLGFTAPILSKTWFHTGRAIDMPDDGYYAGDAKAEPLRPTLVHEYHLNDAAGRVIDPDEDLAREIARTLSGSVLRAEVFAADDDPETAVPYSVQENRALIRQLRPKGKHHPYAVLQSLALESIAYQYEPQVDDDPLIQHTLNLQWDKFGSLTHGFVVHYARRKTDKDSPPFAVETPGDESDEDYENRWWLDAHDEAQQCWYLSTAVTLPDGCTTRILDVDYRSFLPAGIIDPNQNTQEARYNAFGEVLVTSFYGTELGVEVGFDPLSGYQPPEDRTPAGAIADKHKAIGNYATATFSAPFSWMGQVPASEPSQWLRWARIEGFVLPDGHICSRARAHLECLQNPSADEQRLQRYVENAHREPVHVVTLQADRYPGDPELQIRAAIVCWDGFGRSLQTKQEVEPGLAWWVDEKGELTPDKYGRPKEGEAARRWRVSERVEYNNKGEKVRIYRPYFASAYRYINDASIRETGYHDQQFYDAAGRPTHTVLAKKMLQGDPPQEKPLRREQRYRTWYTIAFDENDLFDPPPVQRRNNWTLH